MSHPTRSSSLLSLVLAIALAASGCGGGGGGGGSASAGLDPTFGGTGAVLIPGLLREGVMDVAQLANERLVLVGGRRTDVTDEWLVWVLEASGALSGVFTGDGVEAYPMGRGAATAMAVEVQADGLFVVGGDALGATDQDFVFQRLDVSGTDDLGFHGGVPQLVDLGGHDYLMDIVVQPDGCIVGVGESDGRIAAVRILPGGGVDPSFGTGGRVVIPLGLDARANGVAIQSSGALVLAGTVDNGPATGDAGFVLRLTSAGDPDPSFQGNGIREFDLSDESDRFNDVLIRADDSIIAAGIGGGAAYGSPLVVGLGRDGGDHPAFGSSGTVEHDVGEEAEVMSVLETADGGLVLTSIVVRAIDDTDLLTLRLKSEGSLDATFMGTGSLTVDLMPADAPTRSTLQSDGRLVQVGYAASDLFPAMDGHALVVRTVLD